MSCIPSDMLPRRWAQSSVKRFEAAHGFRYETALTRRHLRAGFHRLDGASEEWGWRAVAAVAKVIGVVSPSRSLADVESRASDGATSRSYLPSCAGERARPREREEKSDAPRGRKHTSADRHQAERR